MKHMIALTLVSAALSGCALVPNALKPDAPVLDAPEPASVRPEARPETDVVEVPVAPPAAPVAQSGALGTTVASLGSPAEQGLWMKTPLVGVEQSGRVSYNGKSIDVKLIPLDGPRTGGSRLSLQGFQALGAPLTDLVEVSVST